MSRRAVAAVVLLALLTSALPAAARLLDYEEPTRTIFLVRHGFYDTADTADPDIGRALLTLGRQQARLTADRFDAMPLAITSIQASAMTRARQTAALIAPRFPDLELQIHRDIRECTMTTRRQDIMDELEPGEAEECETKLAGAWERIFRPASGDTDEFDIVVCHGNVIRWFVTRVLDVDPTAWLGMSIANCSVTVVQVRREITKGRWH